MSNSSKKSSEGAMFGWCQSGQHEQCWAVNNELTCGCKCHNGGSR